MAGGKMLLWMSLAARLAPLLLMTSAVLVATRFLHDRFGQRSKMAGSAAAIAVLAGGLVVIVPYAARMGLILGIRYAFDREDWPVVRNRIDLYEKLGGSVDGNLRYDRGAALVHEGRIAEALSEFSAAATSSNDPLVSRSDAVFNAALCLYALRREDDARRALSTLPDDFHSAATRDYILGRIAEHGGDPAAEAWFRRSLAADVTFQPAVYRLLRLLSMRHDLAAAEQVMASYRRLNPAEANAPALRGMMEAIRRGEVLIDYEPLRLQP